MKVTFLIDVELDITDPTTLLAVADEIHEALEGAVPVLEVRPWNRHGTQQAQQGTGLGAIPGLPASPSVPPLGGSLAKPWPGI